jgi:N6-adenosine-specific RNA methylase IME4
LPARENGQRRDKVAAAVGTSGRTLDKARAVVEAAERDPNKFARVLLQMDKTGNIHGAYRVLVKLQDADAVAANAKRYPTERFHVIVCDPAWRYAIRASDATQRGNTPYGDMSIDEICALPVPELAADDCIMWLWTTNLHMRDAFTVLDAWGCEPKTILTWGKQRLGIGTWLRGQTEHAILAVRGRPKTRLTNQSTLLLASAGRHSAKPDEFYRLVEDLCPGSKLDMFARRQRPGWVAWGNEVPPVSATGVVPSRPAKKRVTRPANPRTSGRTKVARVGA